MVLVLDEALMRFGMSIQDLSASVQGFGKVAQHAARRFAALGGKVAAVASWNQADARAYTFRKEGGLDAAVLAGITDEYGSIDPAKAEGLGYEVLPGTAWLEQPVDILIPAGLAADGGMSLRDAAYLIAVDRVAKACRARGWV